MTFQIFEQLLPPVHQTVRMYTAPFGSNLGVQGQLLMVNQGNVETTDYQSASDFVRVGLAPGVVLGDEGFIAYDTLVPPNHMTQLQGICLQSGQSLFVYSQNGTTSFVFTGSTITV